MKIKPLSRLRTIFQIIGTILPNAYFAGWLSKPTLYVGSAKGIVPPILNCYACPSAYVACPVGSLQHFMVIKAMPYFVPGILIIIGSAVGRFFCGWACPFGFLQDLLQKIPSPKISMPKWFRFGKYAFLILTVFLIPYLITDTVFCKLCPQGALQGGIPQMLLNSELHHLAGTLYWIKVIILLAVIVAALLIKRIFCRAICPLGAFLGIFNKVSFLQLSYDREKCTSCKKCELTCPVDIHIDDTLPINTPECIRCGLCTSCPASAIKFTSIFSMQSPALQKSSK